MTEEKKRNIWFVLTIITSSVYLLWRIFFYYTVEWGRDTGGCGDYPYSGGDGDYTGDGGTDGQPNEEQRL